jgi:hypothetical protein
MGEIESKNSPRPQVLLALAVEGSLAFLAITVAWLVDLRPFDQIDPSIAQAILRGIVATLPMLLMLVLLLRSRLPALVELRDQVNWLVKELLGGASVVQLALIAAVAGFSEELLFRGVLQPLVDRFTSPFVAIVLVSIVFGLMHALSRAYFVFATLVSLYLGWLAWNYSDLVAPIVVHALYDFVALVWFVKKPPVA